MLDIGPHFRFLGDALISVVYSLSKFQLLFIINNGLRIDRGF